MKVHYYNRSTKYYNKYPKSYRTFNNINTLVSKAWTVIKTTAVCLAVYGALYLAFVASGAGY